MGEGKRGLWVGLLLLLGGLFVLFGAAGSCVSNTQPNPPGWPFPVAPRSWSPFLLILSLAGVVAAGAGISILVRAFKSRRG